MRPWSWGLGLNTPAGSRGRAPGLALLCLLLTGAAPETGAWRTQNGASVIAIAPCGDGLCGRIVGVRLDHPTDPPPRDKWGGLQCGETIIRMPRYGADGRWHGTILDPRSGQNWSAQLWAAPDGLHLRGYIGLPFFGGTQVWTPYAGPIGTDCHFEF